MTGGSAARMLPAAGVLGLWVALMPADGGYFSRDWSPAGLVVAGLWLVTVIAGGRLLPAGRPARVGVLALAGLAAFAFLSITWAASPGTAWATANQFLTVVLAVWTLALLPWTAGWAQLLLGLFGVGAAAAMYLAVLSALGEADLSSHFIEDRWASPIGYPNGLGNFGFFAALPMIAISADPRRAPWVKAGALAVATLLAGCALLPQSRGSLLALIVAVPVLIALSPRRWRTTARVAVVGGAIAIASGPIFSVYDALTDEKTVVSGALGDAARAIAFAAIGALAAGFALAALESRMTVGERGVRAARVSGFAVVGLIALGLIGAAGVNADRIHRVAIKEKKAWQNPKVRYVDHGKAEGSRLLDPDPLQRYEYWHICLDAFAEHPLGGLGAGGFELRYTKERAYLKYASFPHALFMRALAEAGIVGLLGVLAFIGAVLAGLFAGWRRTQEEGRTVIAAALGAGVLFTIHAQLDWLEEFPALAGPALAFLLVAMIATSPAAAEPAPEAPFRTGMRIGGAAAIVLVTMVSVALPFLALRYKERASAEWRTDPAGAYRDLDRASSLDPLAVGPKLSEGTIALQRHEYARARRAFEASLDREEGWLAHFELGVLDAANGDRRAAMRQLSTAHSLNPIEAAVSAAQEEIGAGKAVDPVRLNRRLFESPLFNAGRLT